MHVDEYEQATVRLRGIRSRNAEAGPVSPGWVGVFRRLTFRVETPCTYISARALTNAFSERW
jgi:hypothetical protein